MQILPRSDLHKLPDPRQEGDWLIQHEDSLIEAIRSGNHRRRMLGTKAYCKALTRIRHFYAR